MIKHCSGNAACVRYIHKNSRTACIFVLVVLSFLVAMCLLSIRSVRLRFCVLVQEKHADSGYYTSICRSSRLLEFLFV